MSIGEIFADAQRSAIGHKTLAKRLKRLEQTPDFNSQIQQCVFRVLDVSKSELAGNRVVKFLTTYLESADASSPIISAILLSLLPHLCAKDKTVRYRSTQLVSQILGVLTAIDDDLYAMIRHELLRRLHDKVPAIRLEAVLALGRLVENEMDEEQENLDSEEEVALGLLDQLLDVLQNDTNADVRRALLLNLPITPTTLPYLLERARDRDAPTRRALYSRLLPTLGDFRHLSLSMREKLLRWGLRDRDEKVRKAAAKLFRERWIEDCAGSRADNQADDTTPKKELHDPSIPALLELLERIDILNSGNETGVALEAMKEFWDGRPDYLDAVTFDDDFWDKLTPESAFMARTFNEYCQQNSNYHSMIEEKMPEVTRLGFYLQKYINLLIEKIHSVSEIGNESEEETAESEFIVEQLLHIAQTLDYTDEIGRRKMFSLLREALAMADLPEESTRLAIEALRLVCNSDAAGEREFISVILEALNEVHDTIGTNETGNNNLGDESFVSARSEVSQKSHNSSTPTKSKPEDETKVIKEILVNLKCLHIAQCMLQNITSTIQSNVQLETMLNTLIIPAVRSHDAPIRERGLMCLGLSCLLEPSLAESNTEVFITCLHRGNASLKVMAVQILCDLILSTKRPNDTLAVSNVVNAIVKAMLNTSQNNDEEEGHDDVMTTCTTSLSKLMICGFYASNRDLFDNTVEKSCNAGVKGWQLLHKVRDAVKN